MTEETISYLGRITPEHMGVIARTTSMAYKRTSKSIREIGAEPGVDYILESSVRREDDRVRITSQLVRVKDQTTSGHPATIGNLLASSLFSVNWGLPSRTMSGCGYPPSA